LGAFWQARLAFLLRRYWFRRGLLVEGRSWLESALNDHSDRISVESGELHNAIGVFALSQGDDQAATSHFELAEVSFASANSANRLAGVQINLAILYDRHQQFDQAISAYDLAIKSLRAIGDTETLWNAHLNLSLTLRKTGDVIRAKSSAEESLQFAVKHADSARKAISLASLAGIEIAQENINAAARYAVEALEIWQADPAPTHIADLLCKCCSLALLRGDNTNAIWFQGAVERILADRRIQEPDEMKEIFERISPTSTESNGQRSTPSWSEGHGSTIDTSIVHALAFCRSCINYA
jgi:tetratricopeptide (TPR) repeat protein